MSSHKWYLESFAVMVLNVLGVVDPTEDLLRVTVHVHTICNRL